MTFAAVFSKFIRKYYLYPLEGLSFFKLLQRMFILYVPFAAITAAYLIAKDWPFARPTSIFVTGTSLFFLAVPAFMDIIHWSVYAAGPRIIGPFRTGPSKSTLSYLALGLMKTMWIAAASFSVGFIDITLQSDRSLEMIRVSHCSRSQDCENVCQSRLVGRSLESIIECQNICRESSKYCDENYFRDLLR